MPIVISGAAASTAATGRTLATIRTSVANLLQLLAPQGGGGTVTATGTEPAASFADGNNPDALEREQLAGGWVLFTSGSNVGTYRLLAGNEDGEISLANAVANPIAVGDAYEIYRRFPPPTFRDALNYAIIQAYPHIYSSWEQEVAEDPTTLEYEYPTLLAPSIDSITQVAPGGGHTYSYQLVARNDAGDSLAGAAKQVTSGASLSGGSYNVINWTANTNADSYILLRSVDGATYQQLTTLTAAAQGQPETVLDQGQYTASTYTALQPNPPQLFEVRQLWRRTNPSTTGQTVQSPPTYQQVAGSLWDNMGDRVRVHYQTTSGMALTFVGMAPLARVTNDTDPFSQLLPDEVLRAGAAKYLYQLMLEGEAGSARTAYEKQQKFWDGEFTRLIRQHAMPQMGQQVHPPRILVRQARFLSLGPTYSGK